MLTLKRYITWLLAIVAYTAYSQTPQQTIILNQPESGTEKYYVARDNIQLLPGFSFTAGSNTEKKFSAKIDPGLLFPPTDKTYKKADGTFTNDPTQGAVVGSIPGQFAVSPTGAAIYEIPLKLPPGINKMRPELSIVYNNQRKDGVLGIGWDLTGNSVITRGSKNIFFDGVNNPVSLESDAIYLDRQRLLLISGNPFVNNATYAPEIENYSRITYANSGFKLYTIDGKVFEYGVTSDSKIKSANGGDKVLGWRINKIIDTYGNCIVYTYSNNGQYLTNIDYAGQSIEFAYNYILSKPQKQYIKDFLLTKTQLLSSITIKYGTETNFTYSFEYVDDKLTTISQISGSNNEQINPTIINWGLENNEITSQVVTEYNIDKYLGQNGGSIFTGDVNNDGYDDLIEFWAGCSTEQGHFLVRLFNPTTQHFETQCNGAITYFAYYDPKTYKPQIVVNDIDNDGKNEIILFNGGYLYTYKFDNNSITLNQSLFVIASSHFYKKRDIKLISGEWNHDQYNDLVLVLDGFEGEGKTLKPGYIFIKGSADGLVSVGSVNLESTISNYMTITNNQIGDYNGDGLIDAMAINTLNNNNLITNDNIDMRHVTCGTYGQLLTENFNFITCDFNGDGLSDLLSQSTDDYTWKLLENTGDYNTTPSIKQPALYPVRDEDHILLDEDEDERSQTYVLDFNGDGFQDFVIGDETFKSCGFLGLGRCFDYTTWYFYENVAGSLVLKETITSSYRIERMKGLITDINGDGIVDLVLPISDDATSTYNYIAYTMPYAYKSRIVESITNGMGQNDFFTFKNFTSYDQTNSSPPLQNLKAPILIVDTHKSQEGIITQYQFEKPIIHTDGKGFLGFSNVTTTDLLHGLTTHREYEVEQTCFEFLLKRQVTGTTSGEKITELIQTNEIKQVGTKRYIPIIKKQLSEDFLTGISKNYETNYDNFPNSYSQTTTIGNLTTKVETTFTGPEGRILYLPKKITETRTLDGVTQVRVINYDYEFENFTYIYKISRITETKDPSDENEVVTTTIFDSWGNPKSVSVTANGNTRTTSADYQIYGGRFIGSSTNVFEETIVYDWDVSKGLLKSETLSDKLKTWNKTINYEYDSWGSIKQTIYPDGNRKTSVLQWANVNAPAGAAYYSYSQTSLEAPIVIWYDVLNREIQRDTYGLNNKKICVSTEYYPTGVNKGRIARVSEPYFEGDNKTWAITYNTYDSYGRITLATTPMGQTLTTYDGLITTVITPEQSKTTELYSCGLQKSVTKNDKTVSYTYYPSGLIKATTPEDGPSIIMNYNLQGNRIELKDPDGGEVYSTYNGFNELVQNKQRIHNGNFIVTTINYQPTTGLPLTSVRGSETTTYIYDADNNYKSRIKSIKLEKNQLLQHKQTFCYDNNSRVTNVIEEIDGRTFNRQTEYDALGRVKKEIYPNGYFTTNHYDGYSNIIKVTDATRTLWETIETNARGQLLEAKKGGKSINYTYDDRGFNTSVYSVGIIDMFNNFDSKGNLEYRGQLISPFYLQEEWFTYDAQNRLTDWDIYQDAELLKHNGLTYNSAGNIETKTDLGNFTLKYGENSKPHSLTSINGVPSAFPIANLELAYTDFRKVKTITEGIKSYEITYGVDEQRRKSVYKVNGIIQKTTYYFGDYEEEVDINGNIKKIHYLSTGDILISHNNNVATLYYAYTDYQGSLIKLTDTNGNVVESYAYDPWGVRRNPENWAQTDSRTSWLTNRGYTGHEHLDAFGIINMNGRVYDPLTAQFFSPDPYIYDLNDWLSYNRYSYVLNNPFKYTDPSGEIPWIIGFGISLGINYLAGVRDTGWKNWMPQWGAVVGYSSNTGFYMGFSTDGGNTFSNIGVTRQGFTSGTTINGITNMELVNSAPLTVTFKIYNDITGWNGWANVWGGVQMVGGTVEAVAGGAFAIITAETGVGAVAGYAILLNGIDNMQAGFRQMWTGEAQQTMLHIGTSYVARTAGADYATAEMIATGVDYSTIFLGGFNSVKTVTATSKEAKFFTTTSKEAKVASGVKNAGSAAKGGIQLTKKTFGHTFTTHGDDMTNFLINRAKGSGMAQGQFLNNQKAAQFILDNVGKTANGAVNIPIPKGFPARVIMPDGTFKAATHIRLIPGGGGVKTAYPLIP